MSRDAENDDYILVNQGWWVIQDLTLLAMLREVAEGAEPDMVFAEHYANCKHEHR